MSQIREILLEINSQLEKKGIPDVLVQTKELIKEDPADFIEDDTVSMMHTAPEMLDLKISEYKNRIKYVINAMCYVTLEHWDKKFMEKTGPEIFKPLIEILNS